MSGQGPSRSEARVALEEYRRARGGGAQGGVFMAAAPTPELLRELREALDEIERLRTDKLVPTLKRRLMDQEAKLAEMQARLNLMRDAATKACERAEQAEAREAKLREAAQGFVAVIDAAGLNNLANGVQLGATSWYVKASDRRGWLLAALAASPEPAPQAQVIDLMEVLKASLAKKRDPEPAPPETKR